MARRILAGRYQHWAEVRHREILVVRVGQWPDSLLAAALASYKRNVQAQGCFDEAPGRTP
ncbi:hypothetical protein [Caballeronia sp. LZ035]|uniref:hypothetical protein n=1 Tax=Caballeronia sp. LZ035 TaxID=3038568 RepID=UPI002857AA71|nr:hypothetical protein [Caballeronia sp. LZ035]MDR5755609.1 hypothetical protein [Caballeronia sp. LZ035]